MERPAVDHQQLDSDVPRHYSRLQMEALRIRGNKYLLGLHLVHNNLTNLEHPCLQLSCADMIGLFLCILDYRHHAVRISKVLG